MTRTGNIRIGVSGWTYKPWRGAFFPEGLKQSRELAFAARQFGAIEINGTFYSLQRPASFARWAEQTPDDFIFAVKGGRFITHMKRLREIDAPLANFFASGLLRLGAKLGPILWQFPASFAFEPDRLEAFLQKLPHDTEAAVRLACNHDHRVDSRDHLETDAKRPIRHAVEIRHESFRDPRFIGLLKAHRVALVCADTVEWPLLMDLTADFVYCRLHGSEELYRSRYKKAALNRWAARIRAWSTGREMTDGHFIADPVKDHQRRDVYLFFDNTDKLHAPDDARSLMRRLGLVRTAGDQEPGAAAA